MTTLEPFLRKEFQSDIARITTRAKNTSGLRDLVVLVLRCYDIMKLIGKKKGLWEHIKSQMNQLKCLKSSRFSEGKQRSELM